ncbi:GlxA family transcriptional regulator [Shewanella zhangzhouensis]|uniref:GlxA family transcriptional regulator n=1 Tax=Shewanella zhangzhouensis TaxID=2864213 RepID=UPI001C659D22|nr:helix-turn-helix domain-containing protein [Shewanella zhangzhouensis]QYK07036.1 helix-turn-helix domain-containing protein [Shewanella zhangzhouensis]
MSYKPLKVAVVAFQGISPFHLAVPSVVFAEGPTDKSFFEVFICSAEQQPLTCNLGYHLSGLHDLSQLQRANVIVIPSWRSPYEQPTPELVHILRNQAAQGTTIVGLCLGAFVLAAAGLLDGHQATTHWECADELQRLYPKVHVTPDLLYVESGNIMTSAGTAAGLDACLALVRKRFGATLANQVARRLVIPPHRDGGQAQYIEMPLPQTAGHDRLSSLIQNVRGELEKPHTLDSLAAEVAMSRRSFTRQFRQLTGTTVMKWLIAERLNLAQRLLEHTEQPIERVAELSGFGSVESLRHHFRLRFKTSPMQWRRVFHNAMQV